MTKKSTKQSRATARRKSRQKTRPSRHVAITEGSGAMAGIAMAAVLGGAALRARKEQP